MAISQVHIDEVIFLQVEHQPIPFSYSTYESMGSDQIDDQVLPLWSDVSSMVIWILILRELLFLCHTYSRYIQA